MDKSEASHKIKILQSKIPHCVHMVHCLVCRKHARFHLYIDRAAWFLCILYIIVHNVIKLPSVLCYVHCTWWELGNKKTAAAYFHTSKINKELFEIVAQSDICVLPYLSTSRSSTLERFIITHIMEFLLCHPEIIQKEHGVNMHVYVWTKG